MIASTLPKKKVRGYCGGIILSKPFKLQIRVILKVNTKMTKKYQNI